MHWKILLKKLKGIILMKQIKSIIIYQSEQILTLTRNIDTSAV